MELAQIRVEELFGRFSYNIELKRPERITILHAPNGFGKTVLLNLVNSFFTRQFEPFFKYQFSKLHLVFDDGPSIQIERVDDPSLFRTAPKSRHVASVIISSSVRGDEAFHLRPVSDDPEIDPEDFLPVTRVGPDTWIDDETEEPLSRAEVFQRFPVHLSGSSRKRNEPPDWLRKIMDATDCRLIETQRLLRIAGSNEPRRTPRRVGASNSAVVELEARDLADRIRQNLAEFANNSQRLDQSFPRRVIGALSATNAPSPEEASQRLLGVEKRRAALIDTGLLDQAGAPEVLSEAALQGDHVRKVMGVYLDDMEQKLSKFDQLFERVSLFQEMISEKFQFKRLSISRATGISIKADDDQNISLTDLSSGEQHELVLLYELLFRVRENALILIDEPELSLHVAWQLKFLPDIERIQRLRPLQVIVATHSPQIINDRWDIAVELKR